MPEQQMLHRDIEFDSLQPEDKIRQFVAFAADVVSRYNINETMTEEYDTQTQDMLHYIELSNDKNAMEGFKAYKRLAELRRERRKCKNENDLLRPVYEFFEANKSILNQLRQLQGKCRTSKDVISKRKYTLKTNITDL